MSDILQCYIVGLVSGAALMSIPVVILQSLLKRERERNHWFRWWQRHEKGTREGRP